MSYLVPNPEYRFSRDETHILEDMDRMYITLTWYVNIKKYGYREVIPGKTLVAAHF